MDFLETVTLSVNYLLLFTGISMYGVLDTRPWFDKDREFVWLYESALVIILVGCFIFIAFILALDFSKQGMRFYARAQGGGKYGKGAELVLIEATEETIKQQELASKYLTDAKMYVFYSWLETAGSEEKALFNACFHSLDVFNLTHESNSALLSDLLTMRLCRTACHKFFMCCHTKKAPKKHKAGYLNKQKVTADEASKKGGGLFSSNYDSKGKNGSNKKGSSSLTRRGSFVGATEQEGSENGEEEEGERWLM